jgi:hypothetical protein
MAGNETDTFANIIEEARKVPDNAEPTGDIDIPQMFQKDPGNPNIGKADGGQGLELKYTGHSAVFLLWRPWAKCGRCSRDIDANAELMEKDPTVEPLLPDVGDYTCPHNQTTDYKNIIDRCLSDGFILRKEEFFNMVDGTRCVHITWLEVDPAQAKALALAEEIKKKTQVHPPNLEEAFKDHTKKPPEKKDEQAKA